MNLRFVDKVCLLGLVPNFKPYKKTVGARSRPIQDLYVIGKSPHSAVALDVQSIPVDTA